MKILHLLSNRKWTERSEPVADLVLAQQALGQDARLACGKWTLENNEESSAAVQAKKKGLDPLILNLNKHFSWSGMREDVPQLRELIEQSDLDVLHAHMENAHLLAALAVRKISRRPRLVVSHYGVQGPRRGVRNAILYRKAADACTVITGQARESLITRYGRPPDRVEVIEPGIDLDRFHPNRLLEESFQVKLPDEAWVVGMVTRIRADRRVDLAVSALAALKDSIPNLHLLLVGHGEEEAALREQVKQAGMEDRVTWAGYCRGDQLVLAYRAMNLLFYPIPGTDASCRTVREALAAGVPVMATRTGFLNHLIEEGETGLFIELQAEDLAANLNALIAHPATLSQLKTNALARATDRFSLKRQAEKNLALYQRI